MSSKWRFQGKKFHLTYKTHIGHEELKQFLEKVVGPLEQFSFVHELGSEENSSLVEPCPLPETAAATDSTGSNVRYAHTHVLIGTKFKLSSRKQDLFDYQGLHPNFKPINTVLHWRNTWEYHKKDPILLTQSCPLPDNSAPSQMQALIDAPSLTAALIMSGIEIKTVTDLVHLRSQKESLTYVIPPIQNKCQWNMDFIRSPCVLLTGISGGGKTRFALDHFCNPLLVSRMEDLKRLNNKHDGIVFDDISLAGYTIEDCIHIFDIEMPRTINVKHGSVTIPSGLPRIITSNKPYEELFPFDPAGALRRRLYVCIIVQKLYNEVQIPYMPTDSEWNDLYSSMYLPELTDSHPYPDFLPPIIEESSLGALLSQTP